MSDSGPAVRIRWPIGKQLWMLTKGNGSVRCELRSHSEYGLGLNRSRGRINYAIRSSRMLGAI